MDKKPKFPFFIFISLGIALMIMLILHVDGDIAVLNPSGMIALKERDLILSVTAMMFIVVLPVFIFTFFFAWKYRSDNAKAKYSPNWDRHPLIESAWWAVPCLVIVVIAVIAWNKTYELDPYRPIDPHKKSLKVQVVALQWKWLFIYPEQKIASVNFVQFPEQMPIDFEITADAPMNSLWIPQLGGQIYAMPGMRSKLHLIADETGDFRGSSANLSGTGFAGMTFTVRASTQEEFDAWVQSVQQGEHALERQVYDQLALPSTYNPVAVFSLTDLDLFDQIVMKYMSSGEDHGVQ